MSVSLPLKYCGQPDLYHASVVFRKVCLHLSQSKLANYKNFRVSSIYQAIDSVVDAHTTFRILVYAEIEKVHRKCFGLATRPDLRSVRIS